MLSKISRSINHNNNIKLFSFKEKGKLLLYSLLLIRSFLLSPSNISLYSSAYKCLACSFIFLVEQLDIISVVIGTIVPAIMCLKIAIN